MKRKPGPGADLGETGDVAAPVVPEGEVLTHPNLDRIGRGNEFGDEMLRGLLPSLVGEGHDDDLASAACPEMFELLPGRVEAAAKPIWPDDLGRIRFEGHDQQREFELRSARCRKTEQVSMSEMDTIERADRNHMRSRRRFSK
jgi:hypothetical protein